MPYTSDMPPPHTAEEAAYFESLAGRDGVDEDRSAQQMHAEVQCLGGILASPAQWDAASNIVAASDFLYPAHREIWGAIIAVGITGAPVDLITISQHLLTAKRLEAVGGIVYLSGLHKQCDAPKLAVKYAEILRDASLKRRMAELGRSMLLNATHDLTVQELRQSIQSQLEALDEDMRAADGGPRILLPESQGFSPDGLMEPIPPERWMLPGIPMEAYTLLAGGLSSYKTTLLTYLLLWKATGYDVLGLDEEGGGCEPGKVLLMSYEDTGTRLRSKIQRTAQDCRRKIEAMFGPRAAQEFLGRLAQNIQLLPLSGRHDLTLVKKAGGTIEPNEEAIEALTRQWRTWAPEGLLIGLDPLRLAIKGSQNDDDGADVVVHTLNRLACAIPNSGIIAVSHANKAAATGQAGGSGYAAAAYLTSGSALYSQHARSNFASVRMAREEIKSLFSPNDVAEEEAEAQQVVHFQHGRLSHGTELAPVYLLMREGTLTRIKAAGEVDPEDQAKADVAALVPAIDRLHGRKTGSRVSKKLLEEDMQLLKVLRGREPIRAALERLMTAGHLAETGKTKDRDIVVQPSARALLEGGSCH